jgi:putative transposase
MNNIKLPLRPACAAYLTGLIYHNTRTSCLSLAGLCAQISHDSLRRVLFQQLAWSRRLWDCFASKLVREGGYLILDDTTWQRWAQQAAAVSLVWSATAGRIILGMQVVFLVWIDGHWKIPLGLRIWRPRGPSKIVLAEQLLREAHRRGLSPAYVLFDSWYATASLLNLLENQGWKYVARLKSNRLLNGVAVKKKWPHRFGHVRGWLRKVKHAVLVVKDGRRYFVTNATTLTSAEVQRQYRRRQQIEETFRLLKQEFGRGAASHQKLQAQNAHLHLGLYALCLVQVAAAQQQQTIYAFRRSLFRLPIPDKLVLAEGFLCSA